MFSFNGIEFANPDFFWAMLIIPLMVIWYFVRQKKLYGTLRTKEKFPLSALAEQFATPLRIWMPLFKSIEQGLRLKKCCLRLLMAHRPYAALIRIIVSTAITGLKKQAKGQLIKSDTVNGFLRSL